MRQEYRQFLNGQCPHYIYLQTHILHIQIQIMQRIPQPIKNIPQPIKQTKIKRTYQDLTHIPIVSHCHHIKQLYLSHNQIQQVKGLSQYTNLKCLNLSYNKLKHVNGFIEQVVGIKPLRKVNIRMNEYHYGYEDQIVFSMPYLQRLDDIDLSKLNIRKMSSIGRKISDNIIGGFMNINHIIQHMLNHHQLIEVKYIANLSNKYIHHTNNNLQKLQAILSIVKEFNQIQYTHHHANTNYEEECTSVFHELTRNILVKFSQRFHYQLQKRLIHQGGHHQEDYYALANEFGKIGGFKYSIDQQPGKYIQIINKDHITHHPMLQYLHYKKNNMNSLDGQGRTRYSLLAQHNSHIHNHNHILQCLPIFIFQNNYIQILYEICIKKVGALISVYDRVQKQAKYPQIRNKENKQTINVSSIIEQRQKSKQCIYIQPQQQVQPNIQQRPTLHKQNHTNISRQISGSQWMDMRRTQVRKNRQKHKQITKPNYNKYSIYQINLAYKVLCALKKNKVKRQRRKTINKYNNNTYT